MSKALKPILLNWIYKRLSKMSLHFPTWKMYYVLRSLTSHSSAGGIESQHLQASNHAPSPNGNCLSSSSLYFTRFIYFSWSNLFIYLFFFKYRILFRNCLKIEKNSVKKDQVGNGFPTKWNFRATEV